MKLNLKNSVSIHQLKPSNLSVAITGFKACIKNVDLFLKNIDDIFAEKFVQVIDGELILSEKMVLAAVINSLTYSGKKWISSPKIRFLAFLACEKQIKDVFSKIGLREGLREKLLLVVVSELKPNDLLKKISDFYLKTGYEQVELNKVFSKSKREILDICRRYGISEAILSVFGEDLADFASKLIIERMSILKLKI